MSDEPLSYYAMLPEPRPELVQADQVVREAVALELHLVACAAYERGRVLDRAGPTGQQGHEERTPGTELRGFAAAVEQRADGYRIPRSTALGVPSTDKEGSSGSATAGDLADGSR